MSLPTVHLQEGSVMLFEDGEVYRTVLNTSFTGQMYKHTSRQLDERVVRRMFSPDHMFYTHKCMYYESWESFESQYATEVLRIANQMLKSIGIEEVIAK